MSSAKHFLQYIHQAGKRVSDFFTPRFDVLPADNTATDALFRKPDGTVVTRSITGIGSEVPIQIISPAGEIQISAGADKAFRITLSTSAGAQPPPGSSDFRIRINDLQISHSQTILLDIGAATAGTLAWEAWQGIWAAIPITAWQLSMPIVYLEAGTRYLVSITTLGNTGANMRISYIAL